MIKKKEYCVCPLCGRNRALETKEKGFICWDFFNKDSFIIQVRSAPGGKVKGSGKTGRGMQGKAPGTGFHLIEKDSLTLDQIINNDKYKQLLINIKKQLLKINKIFIEKKIIKKSDLKL